MEHIRTRLVVFKVEVAVVFHGEVQLVMEVVFSHFKVVVYYMEIHVTVLDKQEIVTMES